MKTDVRTWAKMYLKDLKAKIGRYTHTLISTFPEPGERFKDIHVDITEQFPTREDQSYQLNDFLDGIKHC